MRMIGLLVVFLLIGSPAAAQQQRASVNGSAPKKLVISDAAIAAALSAERPSVLQERRDSLKNGAIIGAVIGGAAMAIFSTFLCNALHEEGNPPCWRGVLTVSALAAGAGAAAGAGIDALAARNSPSFDFAQGKRPILRVRF